MVGKNPHILMDPIKCPLLRKKSCQSNTEGFGFFLNDMDYAIANGNPLHLTTLPTIICTRKLSVKQYTKENRKDLIPSLKEKQRY